MKLQKRLSRKYKDKIYYKYQIVIPEEVLREANLKEGDNLEVISRNHELIIKKIA